MQRHDYQHLRLRSTLLALCVILSLGGVPTRRGPAADDAGHSYLVQALDVQTAEAAVRASGGTVVRPLPLIGAVEAQLNGRSLARLHHNAGLAITPNSRVAASGGRETLTTGYLLYPSVAAGAHLINDQIVTGPKTRCDTSGVRVSATEQETRPLRGWGVTVAVIDSGFVPMDYDYLWKQRGDNSQTLVAEHEGRCLIYRDFLRREQGNQNSGRAATSSVDQHGHGTHVASTIGDNRMVALAPGEQPAPIGVAPEANLLIARALDKHGSGTYADVIAAIQWIIQYKDVFNVRVLNLSLYAPVNGPYWADPLNQAVMRAWERGLVVVVAAGNAGPQAGTITAPGNVPYVITVGAVKSGRFTLSGNDELAYYSSRGPTESAFVKPDLLVPASRIISPMPDRTTLAQQMAAGRLHERASPNYGFGKLSAPTNYYQLSGTSMGSATVSGAIALLLQQHPQLTNEQVKYRLLATARAAVNTETGAPLYSIWEQGAGLIDLPAALALEGDGRGNVGLDISLDLTTTTHYWGYTTWVSETGEFQLIDPQTGQPLAVWDGTGRSWAGSGQAWGGTGRSWAGSGGDSSGPIKKKKKKRSGDQTGDATGRSWAGDMGLWTNSASWWSGGESIWAGSDPRKVKGGLSHASIVLEDD